MKYFLTLTWWACHQVFQALIKGLEWVTARQWDILARLLAWSRK